MRAGDSDGRDREDETYPGSIRSAGAPAARQAVADYVAVTSAEVALRGAELECIGHRAGSLLEYPRSLRKVRERPLPDIAQLMDRSFREVGLGAIELDVREHRGRAYVVHDPAQDEIETLDYYRRNTLAQVITHFADQGYHRSGHRLYIELKLSPHPDSREVDGLADSAFRAIDQVADARPDGSVLRAAIRFVSFRIDALDGFRKRPGYRGYGLVLIATTNRRRFELVAHLTRRPFLGRAAIARLEAATWLDGVWFDLRWIKHHVDVFNRINAARVRPLELWIATYYLDRRDFFERIREPGATGRLAEVSGLILDFVVPSPRG